MTVAGLKRCKRPGIPKTEEIVEFGKDPLAALPCCGLTVVVDTRANSPRLFSASINGDG